MSNNGSGTRIRFPFILLAAVISEVIQAYRPGKEFGIPRMGSCSSQVHAAVTTVCVLLSCRCHVYIWDTPLPLPVPPQLRHIYTGDIHCYANMNDSEAHML